MYSGLYKKHKRHTTYLMHDLLATYKYAPNGYLSAFLSFLCFISFHFSFKFRFA
ncbi:unnamed protein product [Penicillium roqueforti FM164]|uniref:Genomic scaffold, ProqFM164S02 n=1 Tax=Penicillium roqueforti (strain FM164) TaxID=1365484 RepID=W6Q0M0_PENRF|nr:unnamed protein product [Penicillium roqueforti FM164]